jgi:hypothetical protein
LLDKEPKRIDKLEEEIEEELFKEEIDEEELDEATMKLIK